MFVSLGQIIRKSSPINAFLVSPVQEYMDANKCIDELLKQLEDERRNVRR